MDYSFLAARLSFTFMYTCIFFSWQINSAAAGVTDDARRTRARLDVGGHRTQLARLL